MDGLTDALDLLQPGVAEAVARETLATPGTRHVAATPGRGSVNVRITRVGIADDAPDSRAEIELSGTGSFSLVLNDEFELIEIDDDPRPVARDIRPGGSGNTGFKDDGTVLD